MRDAEFASNIDLSWADSDFNHIIGGYVRRPPGDPAHGWTPAEWGMFPKNKKLPIVVQSNPGNVAGAQTDAFEALQDLYALGVPTGVQVALDLETAVDPTYVQEFGKILKWAGFHVHPYGSTSSIFKNPPLQGYWVASPAANGQPFEYNHPDVVATQYALDVPPGYDASTVRWALQLQKWWV
jgi:hypothetical protein